MPRILLGDCFIEFSISMHLSQFLTMFKFVICSRYLDSFFPENRTLLSWTWSWIWSPFSSDWVLFFRYLIFAETSIVETWDSLKILKFKWIYQIWPWEDQIKQSHWPTNHSTKFVNYINTKWNIIQIFCCYIHLYKVSIEDTYYYCYYFIFEGGNLNLRYGCWKLKIHN